MQSILHSITLFIYTTLFINNTFYKLQRLCIRLNHHLSKTERYSIERKKLARIPIPHSVFPFRSILQHAQLLFSQTERYNI